MSWSDCGRWGFEICMVPWMSGLSSIKVCAYVGVYAI